MKKLLTMATLSIASLGLWTSNAFADSDYHVSNDMSYISGKLETKQHIYYPGDTIDIRVALSGNTDLLASEAVDMHLALISAQGKTTFIPVNNYDTFSTKRLFLIQNINQSVITEGTYQLALIATLPGGDPANINDWYNGFAGMLDHDALLYTETTLSRDQDEDGEWDDDYDRDGYYGDQDDVYEYYSSREGVHFEEAEHRDWNDDDWDNDDSSDDDDRDDDQNDNDSDENDDDSDDD